MERPSNYEDRHPSNEEADALALQRAIKDGQAHQIMDMVREMDEIVAIMGLQSSHESPIDVLRAHPDWKRD